MQRIIASATLMPTRLTKLGHETPWSEDPNAPTKPSQLMPPKLSSQAELGIVALHARPGARRYETRPALHMRVSPPPSPRDLGPAPGETDNDLAGNRLRHVLWLNGLAGAWVQSPPPVPPLRFARGRTRGRNEHTPLPASQSSPARESCAASTTIDGVVLRGARSTARGCPEHGADSFGRQAPPIQRRLPERRARSIHRMQRTRRARGEPRCDERGNQVDALGARPLPSG